jgi:fumarate hydratase class I
VGGAGAMIAQTVQRILGVHKLEFGIPEAVWVIEVKGFPTVVTMDAHGQSLHEQVARQSQNALEKLLKLK